MEEKLKELKSLLDKSKKIVILSGAGVSVNSNIPDFRSSKGLYSEQERVDYLHRNYYNAYPWSFWTHFKAIFGDKLISTEYKPNSAHSFLTELIDAGKEVKVFTQNIDGLYQKVIPKDLVYEMHGTIATYHCPTCKKVFDKDYVMQHVTPTCDNIVDGELCDDILNTDVVLFGDQIHFYDDAVEAFYDADLVLIMGTSLEVFPVSNLAKLGYGAPRVYLNKEASRKHYPMDLCIYGDLADILNGLAKL